MNIKRKKTLTLVLINARLGEQELQPAPVVPVTALLLKLAPDPFTLNKNSA